MSENVQVLRSRLRGLSTTLRGLEDQRTALRDERLTQLQVAMQHRATIREASEASGLSRAYLHKIGMHEHRGAGDDATAREAALEQARDCRRRLDELDDGAVLREERDGLIRTLHDELLPPGGKHSRRQRAEVSGMIAEDTGLTGERVRLILRGGAHAPATPPIVTAQPSEVIESLQQAIMDGRPGTPAVWMHRGVEVTVYGQSRQNMDAPTPWAVITVAGQMGVFTSWDQVIAAAEERAAA